jgi:hypothetical protein
MSRHEARKPMRTALLLLSGIAVAVIGGCAGTGNGSGSVGYSYEVYYGSAWGGTYYRGRPPVYVGPPPNRPRPPSGAPPSRPPGGVRPMNPVARPMPPPRPSPSRRR